MKRWELGEITQSDLEAFIDFYGFESIHKFAAILTDKKHHQKVFYLRYKKKLSFTQIAKEVDLSKVMCKVIYHQMLQSAEGWRYLKEKQEIYWETRQVPEVLIECIPCKQLLRTACWRADIITLTDLAKLTVDQFKSTRGAGKVVIQDAKNFLKMFGLVFANDEPIKFHVPAGSVELVRKVRAKHQLEEINQGKQK